LNRTTLLLNKSIKGPGETLKSWNETKTDPNKEISNIMHDEEIAKNSNVSKSRDYDILHQDSLTKMMQGKVSADDALKRKLELEKSGMLKAVMNENEEINEMGGAFAGGGMATTGTPIAPMNSTPYHKPKKKKTLSETIEKAYNKKRSQ